MKKLGEWCVIVFAVLLVAAILAAGIYYEYVKFMFFLKNSQ